MNGQQPSVITRIMRIFPEKLLSNNAFLLFHFKVGTRLALLKLGPVLGFMFAAYFILRPELFNEYFTFLLHNGSLLPGILFTIILIATSRMSAKRISLGLNGWIGHLPVSSLTNRRLAETAVFIAQIPVILALGILPAASILIYGEPVYDFLSGLPLLGYAAAKASLSTQRNALNKLLSISACILFGSGQWLYLPAGIGLIILTEKVSGPLTITKKKHGFIFIFRGLMLNWAIVWRAIKFRICFPYLYAFLGIGGILLFLENNQVAADLARRVGIAGGAISITGFLAFFAQHLSAQRPAWPWVRSLPWSSRQRILLDSLFFLTFILPLVFIVFFINWQASFPFAAWLPFACIWSSMCLRISGKSKMGPAGRILSVGFVSSLLITILPFVSLVFLGMVPLLLKHAAAYERNLKVSRWLKFHHLAAGDTLSWSKQ